MKYRATHFIVGCFLLFSAGSLFFGQDVSSVPPAAKKYKSGKVHIKGFVLLDGKPVVGATVVVRTATTRFYNDDWIFPIILPHSVTIVGEVGTPSYERPTWYSWAATDKEGYFHWGLPERSTILVHVTAATRKEWKNTIQDAPCGNAVITTSARTANIQPLHYLLESGHTPKSGGCLKMPDTP